LIFFCPNCWAQVREGEKICPECRVKIEPLDQLSYFDKLTRALNHPVATTRMRAAYILGEIGDRRAILPLAGAIENAWEKENLFFLREIAIALGKIDGHDALPALIHLLDHPSFLIREIALRSLGKIRNVKAIAAIQKAMDDPSPGVRQMAKEIIEKTSG